MTRPGGATLYTARTLTGREAGEQVEGITIASQEETDDRDLTGAFVRVVRVTFTVDGEGPFRVAIPVAKFGPDEVNRLVGTYAANVRAVRGLGG